MKRMKARLIKEKKVMNYHSNILFFLFLFLYNIVVIKTSNIALIILKKN